MEEQPAGNDEFDKDITGEASLNEGLITSFALHMAFTELHESYVAMREVGFTESEALRFLAFCSIHEGDL